MSETTDKIEFTVERMIPASPADVFDAWLDPKVPGNPWNAADKFILHPEIDGLFYWTMKGTAHYGRFTAVERSVRLQHTWVSPNTLGLESTVTITFTETSEGTLMTLVHSGLPDNDRGRSHEKGWNFFLTTFLDTFKSRKGK